MARGLTHHLFLELPAYVHAPDDIIITLTYGEVRLDIPGYHTVWRQLLRLKQFLVDYAKMKNNYSSIRHTKMEKPINAAKMAKAYNS
jgi:hypothetical protein